MKNRSVKYFLFFLGIIIIAVIGGVMNQNYYNEIETNYDINIFKEGIINLISFGLIGVLLGVDKFRMEYKKEGVWKLDKAKLFIVAIPSFILSMPIVWGGIILFVSSSLADNAMVIYNFMIIFNMLFGYGIITAFYKKQKERLIVFNNIKYD